MKPTALYILNQDAFDRIYGLEQQAALAERVDFCAPHHQAEEILENPELLADVECIFSGWGAPKMDASFLAAAPRLKAVFYASGSVRYFVTDEFWARDIRLTSGALANAIPVADYTVATTLFSLKHGWKFLRRNFEEQRLFKKYPAGDQAPGTYRSKVGLVALGAIGREVARRMQPFDLELWAFDPFVDEADFQAMNLRKSGLAELFRECDVISLHAPAIPSTEGLIRREHFASMKPGATFINSARPAVIDEEGLAAVLADRPDLHAVLDVIGLSDGQGKSPFLDLPNVTLTPHMAGAMGRECRRLGDFMVEELDRYLAGEPMRGEIQPAALERMA